MYAEGRIKNNLRPGLTVSYQRTSLAGSIDAAPSRQWASLAVQIMLAFWSLVLLSAAILKAYNLYEYGERLFGSRVLVVGVVVVEVLIAAALVLDPKVRRARTIAIVVFSCFAAVACVEGLQGRSSCGCFGPIEVDPWYTLALDLTAVASLLVCGHGLGCFRAKRVALRGAVAGSMIVLAFGSVAMGIASSVPREGVVLLEPETWVGKRLPILDEINIGEQLADGEWLVVLYREDCPQCREELPRYAELSNRLRQDGSTRRVAAIEVPPYGDGKLVGSFGTSGIVFGRLSDRREWFIETPAALRLLDGVCARR